MSSRRQARREFARLLSEHGDEIPLDETAVWIAVEEQPDLDPERPVYMLDALAGAIHLRGDGDVFDQVARINVYLFKQLDFQGDNDRYDEPHNSLIHRVLERRRGLPILLSLIYMEVARRLDVAVDGIGFPGHFLVSPRGADPRFFVDPFRGGAVLRDDFLRLRMHQIFGADRVSKEQEERFLAPVTNRQLMVRVNNNLKASYLKRDNLHAALRAVERLVLLEPDWVEQQRDRGLLLAELGREEEAVRELRDYLIRKPDAADADNIRKRLTDLGSEG